MVLKKGLKRRDKAKKIVPVSTIVGPEDEFKITLASMPIATDSRPNTMLVINMVVRDLAMF